MNILIIKNRAMGDSIIGLSSLSYIKSIFSNIKITYGLPSWIIPLFTQVGTAADAYIPIDLKKITDCFKLFNILKKNKFDLIVELHQNGRTGKFFTLYSKLTSTPYYFHNHHKTGNFIHDQGKKKPAIQRDLDACWSIFCHLYPNIKFSYPQYFQFSPKISLGEMKKQKIIIFGVVATRKTKMWPLSYYKTLCQKILNKDPAFEFLIPLSTSSEDLLIEKEILNLHFPQQVRIIKENLNKLPHLLKESSFYIGNDTGLKHLCVALSIPTITFFGPEEPLEWHPYSMALHPYFFIDGLECRTRISHYCPLNECESMICLNQITPDLVIKKIVSSQLLKTTD